MFLKLKKQKTQFDIKQPIFYKQKTQKTNWLSNGYLVFKICMNIKNIVRKQITKQIKLQVGVPLINLIVTYKLNY